MPSTQKNKVGASNKKLAFYFSAAMTACFANPPDNFIGKNVDNLIGTTDSTHEECVQGVYSLFMEAGRMQTTIERAVETTAIRIACIIT